MDLPFLCLTGERYRDFLVDIEYLGSVNVGFEKNGLKRRDEEQN